MFSTRFFFACVAVLAVACFTSRPAQAIPTLFWAETTQDGGGSGRIAGYSLTGTLLNSTTAGLNGPVSIATAQALTGDLIAYVGNRGSADDFMSNHTLTLGGFTNEGTFAASTHLADNLGNGSDTRGEELFQIDGPTGTAPSGSQIRRIQRFTGPGAPSVAEASQTTNTNLDPDTSHSNMIAINNGGSSNEGNILAMGPDGTNRRMTFREIVSTVGGMTPGATDGSAFLSPNVAGIGGGDFHDASNTNSRINGAEWRPGTDEIFWADPGLGGVSAYVVDIALVNDGSGGTPVTVQMFSLITSAQLATNGGLGSPTDIAFDAVSGDIFVASFGNGADGSANIQRYSPGTGALGAGGSGWTFVSEFGSAQSGGYIDIVDIPVPEPSTLVLGVLVLAGLALGNWRRRSRG